MRTDEYFAEINDLVIFIALIETAEAVANIDEILAVEGVDTFVIGPVDLSISLGVPFDYEGSVFQDAQARTGRMPLAALASPLALESIARLAIRNQFNAP